MKTKETIRFSMILILLVSIMASGCGQDASGNKKSTSAEELKKNGKKFKVTFIELGSVRCIPCQKMQPVMRSIEEKYGKEVKVIFYDVWTPEGKPFAEQYKVEAIPTQVFLDEKGKEFYRHEGYFPEEELVKVLNIKGVQ